MAHSKCLISVHLLNVKLSLISKIGLQEILGRHLVTPNATRQVILGISYNTLMFLFKNIINKITFGWKSFYNSIKCVVQHLDQTDKIFIGLQSNPFSGHRKITFLVDYCKVSSINNVKNYYFNSLYIFVSYLYSLNNINKLLNYE